MSQAFVKEGDASDDLPERPVGDRLNYVTPAGLERLRERHQSLWRRRAQLVNPRRPENESELKLIERDLRYYEARLETAIMVDNSIHPPADVRFGARVELDGPDGRLRYAIVGEDEADPGSGLISWSSPLAMALMGTRAGDEVVFASLEGERRAKVLSVSY